MPEAVSIPVTSRDVIAMRHPSCTFTEAQVLQDEADNWPDKVDLLWILEHGAANTADRTWLALRGLQERFPSQLCCALRRILKRMLLRKSVEEVVPIGNALLTLLNRVIGGQAIDNGPVQPAQWSRLEQEAWAVARNNKHNESVRRAAMAIARMSEAASGAPHTILSEIIRLPAQVATSERLSLSAEENPDDVAAVAAAEEYAAQMADVAAAYRGEL